MQTSTKEKILKNMTQAIQELYLSWKVFDKSAKKIKLTQIKRKFAKEEVTTDPLSSSSVLAFDAELGQTRWRSPNPKATEDYRSQMRALRSKQGKDESSSLVMKNSTMNG